MIEGTKGGGESRYHNPDPLHQLIGPRNEINVVVNEELVKGLVDSGAQISAISMEFVKRHDLPIFQLQQLLDFEGFGGVDFQYIGYTKLTLNIPEIEGFKREILAFVQKDSKYSVEVPLIIGTLNINEILASATAEELRKLSLAWYAGALGSQVLAKLAQLEKRPIIDQIDHYIRLTRDITIPAMQVHRTTGIAKIPVFTKRLNVMTKALPHREEIKGIEAIPSYETFKQGGNRIIIGLNNTTRENYPKEKDKSSKGLCGQRNSTNVGPQGENGCQDNGNYHFPVWDSKAHKQNKNG